MCLPVCGVRIIIRRTNVFTGRKRHYCYNEFSLFLSNAVESLHMYVCLIAIIIVESTVILVQSRKNDVCYDDGRV